MDKVAVEPLEGLIMNDSIPSADDEPKEPFTPGPWVINDEDPENLKVESAHYEDETPGVCGSHSPDWKLTRDDARLIVAAHDLLAAGKLVLESAQSISAEQTEALAAMKAAIVKAEGKSP